MKNNQESSSRVNPNKFNFSISFWLLSILALVIFISSLASFIALNSTNMVLKQKVAATKEAARPANISLTIIQDSSCSDCFDTKEMVAAIKKENVKVISEKILTADSPEAKKLITKFSITKLPTLIIRGELGKNKPFADLLAKIGEIKDKTFVLRNTPAPYVLVQSGKVRGRVEITMLKDNTCTDCYNVKSHLSILKRLGLPVTNQRLVDSSSQIGRKLIRQYKIKLLPTLILSGDLDAYPTLKQIWPRVGTVSSTGTYVFRQGVKGMGVYKDLTTNKVVKPKLNKK